MILVEPQAAVDGQPVLAVGPHLEIEVFKRGLVGDTQLFPFRPFDDHLVTDRLEFEQGLQAVLRVLQMPLPIGLMFQIDG